MESILCAIQTTVDPHKESYFLLEPWLGAELAMHVQLSYLNKMPCTYGNGHSNHSLRNQTTPTFPTNYPNSYNRRRGRGPLPTHYFKGKKFEYLFGGENIFFGKGLENRREKNILANPNSSIRSLFGSWDHFTVTQDQLKAGIERFTSSFNKSTQRLYLASGACLRGKCDFLHDTLKDYPFYTRRDLVSIIKGRGMRWGEASLELALLEQEICANSLAFMGMSKSSWSWEIYLKRFVLAGNRTETSMMFTLNFRHRDNMALKKWHNSSSDGFFDLQLLFHAR